MLRRRLAFLLAIGLVQPLGGCLAAGNGRVSDVVGIDVGEGVNHIARFAPDGRQALIVIAARQTPTGARASEAPAVMVMLPREEPTRGWDLVGVEDESGRVLDGPGSLSHGIGQAPPAIRFARAKVGGLPATLMFVASAAAGATDVTTYRLVTDGDDGSGLSAVFDPIAHRTLRRRFCSADAAIVDVEGFDPGEAGGCAGS